MADKLRICYIGDGRSIHTQRWVKHFSVLGHDVHLITNSDVRFDKVAVHLIGGTGTFSYIRRVFKARKLIKKIKPDVVHAHFVTDSGFLGVLSGYHPLIVSTWGSDIIIHPKKSALFRFIVKYTLKKADVVHCGDENGVKRVVELVGRINTIKKIGWGIDVNQFKPEPHEPRDNLRILYLRISHDVYSTSVLLRALPEVLRKHENIKILILNKGEELDRTMDIVNSLNVKDRVVFIDPVEHSGIPRLMNECDIYVDTYYSGVQGSALGMAALEAMSCGMAVVVADTHGHDNIVKHMVSGYVYKGLDPESLARALDEVISDASLRALMGRNARDFVIRNQNWHENMKNMEKLYLELAKKDYGPR